MNMVKCPRCGYENSATATYCDNCAYLLTDHKGNRLNNNKRTSSWNMGVAKKIVIVLGIVVIALLLFSFVYNNSQPSSEEALNVITDNGSLNHSDSYPYTRQSSSLPLLWHTSSEHNTGLPVSEGTVPYQRPHIRFLSVRPGNTDIPTRTILLPVSG